MQTVRFYIFVCTFFEDSFGNAQWRIANQIIKQMKTDIAVMGASVILFVRGITICLTLFHFKIKLHKSLPWFFVNQNMLSSPIVVIAHLRITLKGNAEVGNCNIHIPLCCKKLHNFFSIFFIILSNFFIFWRVPSVLYFGPGRVGLKRLKLCLGALVVESNAILLHSVVVGHFWDNTTTTFE